MMRDHPAWESADTCNRTEKDEGIGNQASSTANDAYPKPGLFPAYFHGTSNPMLDLEIETRKRND